MIRSHIPGRLRLRSPDPRRPRRNAAACEAMRSWEGVRSVDPNPATGSILLHYDAARLDKAAVEARIMALFAEDPAPPAGETDAPAEAESGLSLWRLNRVAKLGMMGGLAGSMAALAVGKKMHAALGAVHVAFLLIHMANHRKRLLD